jgi:hypothetical protein
VEAVLVMEGLPSAADELVAPAPEDVVPAEADEGVAPEHAALASV